LKKQDNTLVFFYNGDKFFEKYFEDLASHIKYILTYTSKVKYVIAVDYQV